MPIKYQNQVCSVVHQSSTQTQTLGVDCFLSIPKNEDYESGSSNPLEIHGKYSRFKFTLINKKNSGEKVFSTYNISADDIPKIFEDTKYFNQMYLAKRIKKASMKENTSEQTNKVSIAYTKKIIVGPFKGRTPADVLMEDINNKAKLMETIKLLSDNIERYPANQMHIDAINEAIGLSEKGLLKEQKVLNNPYQKFGIYSGIKIPNRNKLDENGNTKVSTIDISYNPEMGYPINISIINCSAPPTQNSNDPIGVQMNKAVNKKAISMFISMEEWFKIISKMDRLKTLFEFRYSDLCFMKWEEENSKTERRG